MAQAWTRTETVQTSQVTGTLTNFPALFSRTHNDFRTVGNGGHVADAQGDDLCLYSDSGLTSLLKMETEKYVASTGEIVKWAKIASIATATVVYWGYGDSGITTSQDDAANVWDTNYKYVGHGGDGSTVNFNDSTSNGNNGGAGVNSPTASTGKFGGGATFNGSNQYVNLGSGSSMNPTAAFTLSGWIKPAVGYAGWMLGRDEAAGRSYAYGPVLDSSGKVELQINGGGAVLIRQQGTALSAGTWAYIVATGDSSQGIIDYFNGASDVTAAWGAPNTAAVDTMIARRGYSGFEGYLAADLDEIRISSIARAAGWISSEYNNQNAPTSFWGLGSESAVGGGGGNVIKNIGGLADASVKTVGDLARASAKTIGGASSV